MNGHLSKRCISRDGDESPNGNEDKMGGSSIEMLSLDLPNDLSKAELQTCPLPLAMLKISIFRANVKRCFGLMRLVSTAL
jgi:hypothetical protein